MNELFKNLAGAPENRLQSQQWQSQELTQFTPAEAPKYLGSVS